MHIVKVNITSTLVNIVHCTKIQKIKV